MSNALFERFYCGYDEAMERQRSPTGKPYQFVAGKWVNAEQASRKVTLNHCQICYGINAARYAKKAAEWDSLFTERAGANP